jgi:hypothetical protein
MNSIARSSRVRILLQQFQHLRLDRDVERRDGLVGDQQFGLHRQRPRDADPLALAAGKLVRVARQGRCVHAHQLQKLCARARAPRRAARRS